MSSRHKLLGIGIILILIVLLAMIILIVPKVEIEINGDSNINVSVGDNYIDKGAKAYLKKFTSKEELSIETIYSFGIVISKLFTQLTCAV